VEIHPCQVAVSDAVCRVEPFVERRSLEAHTVKARPGCGGHAVNVLGTEKCQSRVAHPLAPRARCVPYIAETEEGVR